MSLQAKNDEKTKNKEVSSMLGANIRVKIESSATVKKNTGVNLRIVKGVRQVGDEDGGSAMTSCRSVLCLLLILTHLCGECGCCCDGQRRELPLV